MTITDLFNHQGSPALTRTEMPFTSHWAAGSVNTTKMEKIVLNALINYGPMTSEEIAIKTNQVLTSITPRMAALHERRIVKRPLDDDDLFITRTGKSGCQRLVYEFEPASALWLDKRPVKINRAAKIRQLEAEIEKLNSIISTYERGENHGK